MPTPIRVLCLDDEPELLKIAKLFLEREGSIAVETLTSAIAALEQLKVEHYDAIVADYAMPGMDGIAFLKALRALGNTTPVIIFTGRGREEVVIEALNNGADFYLQKGGNQAALFTELSMKIHYAASRKQAEKALQFAYENLEKLVSERTVQLSNVNRDLLLEIAERKSVEEALHIANKKLNLLASITRHDILNQLTVLIGQLEILEKKQPDNSFSTYFNKISHAANRIHAMIRFTREYERIGVTAPVWQDCRTLVGTAAKDAPLGQVMVKNNLPAGMEVFADSLVVKVFYNLMDNAVRYGGKITTLKFSIEERGVDRVIVCEDDGNGIHRDEKVKIFERGYGKNTGLGLFLSREILDITGITITENGEPGTGARFEMTVPNGAWRMAGDGT